MSLLYTIRALDPQRFRAVVGLIRPTTEVATVYEDHGIEVIPWSGINTFEHSTAQHLRITNPLDWYRAALLPIHITRTVRRTRDLVRATSPDLIHLNSVVLAPSAYALRNCGLPVIWHVREHPVQGYLGIRRGLLKRALTEWPHETIFLSNADRLAWMGTEGGLVIPNFVPIDRFDPGVSGSAIRRELNIQTGQPVILYLGGLGLIKGIEPLLEAIRILRVSHPELRCLMPGGSGTPSSHPVARIARSVLPLIGSGTPRQKILKRLRTTGVEAACILLPFRSDVPSLMAAADVVVFPALEPHFPRPAIEAAAMAKPIVASDFPGTREIISDGKTGLLVPPGDPRQLAAAIERVLRDPEWSKTLGDRARRFAIKRFTADVQGAAIMNLYDRMLT